MNHCPVCGHQAEADGQCECTCTQKPARTWTFINQFDGNVTFTVQGGTYSEAAGNALRELGWGLLADEGEEEEDEPGNAF